MTGRDKDALKQFYRNLIIVIQGPRNVVNTEIRKVIRVSQESAKVRM